MFRIEVKDKKDQLVQSVRCVAQDCQIGASDEGIATLKGWRIAPAHLRIHRELAGLFVENISNGRDLLVNGKLIERYGPLASDDAIQLGRYRISVIMEQAAPLTSDIVAEEEEEAEITINSDQLSTTFDGARSVYMEWAKFVHQELLRRMDLRRVHIDELAPEIVRDKLAAIIDEIIDSIKDKLTADIDFERLKKIVLDEAIGLGALEELIADRDITEVMVNAFDDIYVEKAGRLVPSGVSFTSDDAVMATIERIISPLGRRIDESSPMVDARLRDGSRVNAIIPPLALRGPCITIRKFPEHKLTDRDLIKYGSTNEQMVCFLKSCVEQRRNIIVSGGTGSGKTTLLNILSNFIPEEERVVTIEDAAELRLGQPHVVSLEARPANMEGRGQVTIRDLVKNSLRMRPDRIVVGECRGGEALDMLQAMNTGHDGSLTTAHANSPRDMLRRMEVMVLMAGMDLPISAIREQIASAVDMIIQQTRFADGSRKITHISEITGIESGTIQLNDIYLFKQDGFNDDGRVKGAYRATGMVPMFYEELRERGLQVDMSLFKDD
jgi:pilus assembly protein CpaF